MIDVISQLTANFQDGLLFAIVFGCFFGGFLAIKN